LPRLRVRAASSEAVQFLEAPAVCAQVNAFGHFGSICSSGISDFEKVRIEILKRIIGTDPIDDYFSSVYL
jgi:hypothetical protein